MMEEVKAMMAGNVWKIVVAEGDTVEEDQDIVILESMKMEIPIAAEEAGVVKEIKVAEGDFVNEGDVIAIIES
ncbi:acetyl-CoA carboxylase biotin carboxyl carrier protein subunit [Paucisalibacillus globulus]|uniref:acetyl-CoA carboxylase biotin carboxyl carrier protein subunit n=1 Tax=Paucisalibacillus globulus TaxID=351095 RepID=UPI00159648ED|nr:acetyl-CoA carboxylase biotin carboxyl carrier protein subunit [Paucisalibacillus globulus]